MCRSVYFNSESKRKPSVSGHEACGPQNQKPSGSPDGKLLFFCFCLPYMSLCAGLSSGWADTIACAKTLFQPPWLVRLKRLTVLPPRTLSKACSAIDVKLTSLHLQWLSLRLHTSMTVNVDQTEECRPSSIEKLEIWVKVSNNISASALL